MRDGREWTHCTRCGKGIMTPHGEERLCLNCRGGQRYYPSLGGGLLRPAGESAAAVSWYQRRVEQQLDLFAQAREREAWIDEQVRLGRASLVS